MTVCCLPPVSGMLCIGMGVLGFAKFSHCIFMRTPVLVANISESSAVIHASLALAPRYRSALANMWQYQPWPRSQTFVVALLSARNMNGPDVKWKYQRFPESRARIGLGRYQREPKSFSSKACQRHSPKAISAGHGTRIRQ